MLGRTSFVVAAAGAFLAIGATAASAHSCANLSRPAPPCGMTCTTPVVDGHWVWLPSIGVPVPLWGYDPPEGYINAAGNESLLGLSAICTTGVDARQTDHGIQTGCE
jgi:hypothetical protein